VIQLGTALIVCRAEMTFLFIVLSSLSALQHPPIINKCQTIMQISPTTCKLWSAQWIRPESTCRGGFSFLLQYTCLVRHGNRAQDWLIWTEKEAIRPTRIIAYLKFLPANSSFMNILHYFCFVFVHFTIKMFKYSPVPASFFPQQQVLFWLWLQEVKTI